MEPIARLNDALSSRYEVVREIGAGGMATVYLARDLKHDRNVALKVLKPELGAVLGVDRFLSEIKVTANLQHPNLLPLFDSGEAGGLLFYVMPFVEGETLRARLDREKQLPIDEAVEIACAVARALAYAHERGVIHRDLKPENILMQAGQPLIADFGIALAVSKAGGQRVTESGLSLGTPQYMSPEQAVADRAIDGRSDIYSLAAVTYEMLTGEPPHTGSTAQAIISRVINEAPRPIRASRASVPVYVEQAVHIALSKLPADRFGSAATFGAALQGERSALITAANVSVPFRAHARLSLTWAAVAVVAAAAAFMIGRRSHSPPTPKVLRFTVKLPASQAFADVGGIPVVFSLDGTAIVYGGLGPQGTRLYYRRLDQLEGTPLQGTDGACCPAISPSGDWVAFETTPTPGHANVSKVSVHGGAPVVLGEVVYSGGISWGFDDAIYAGARIGLFRIPASPGPMRRISVLDTARHEIGQYMPVALPDKKNVLVWTYAQPADTLPTVERLAIVRIADGRVTVLDGDSRNPIGLVDGYLVFGGSDRTLGVVSFDPAHTRSVRDVIPVVLESPLARRSGGMAASLSAAGDLVYVSARTLSRLVQVDVQGRVIARGADERNFGRPRVSPDGRHVVVDARPDAYAEYGQQPTDLWVSDIASGAMQRLSSGVSASSPEWTPDGRRVTYLLHPARGPAELWWMPADGTGSGERLVAMSLPIVAAVLSPDARFAVVEVNDPKMKHDLYTVDLKGDRAPAALEHSAFNEQMPAVSPDGRWLAYVSDESGRNEIYVHAFPATGPHFRVTVDGGSDPRWARDSRSLVYRNAERFERAQFALSGNLTVARRDSLFSDVYGSYDLGANGTIWALRSGSNDAEINVVLNWIAELKAKVVKK